MKRIHLVIRLPLLMLAMVAGCGDMDAMSKPYPYLQLVNQGSADPEIGDTLTFCAELRESYGDQVKSHQWWVTDPNNQHLETTQQGLSGNCVSFTVLVAGDHTIYCTGTLAESAKEVSGEAHVHVRDPSIKQLVYTARVLPPPASELPPKDFMVTVGAVSQEHLEFQLDPGQLVSLKVEDPAGSPRPTVVRLQRPGQDPLPRDIYLPSGSGKVKLTGSFHALFVPDSSNVAPKLEPNLSASTLGSTWKVTLDPGKLITGIVKNKDGSPLPGATVSLLTTNTQCGVEVPSTIAVTATDGSYALRTSTGPARLTVVPKEGSGLPLAVIEDPLLSVGGDTSGWDFSFSDPHPVQISGTVTQSDGKTPAVGVRVSLKADFAPQEVGTLTTKQLAQQLPAEGRYRRTLVSGTGGVLTDPLSGATQVIVPDGTYTVEVWPGEGAATTQGYSRTTVDLQGLGAKQLALMLSPRVKLSGHVVSPDNEPVRARVSATSSSGQFETTTDPSTGSFALSLDDETTYSVVVRSLSSSLPLSTYIDPKVVVAGDIELHTIALPEAILVAGSVTSGGAGIPGALIRIWCSGPDCTSDEVVDEVHTRADGTFELRVPPSEASW
jgi:hypothetical protein